MNQITVVERLFYDDSLKRMTLISKDLFLSDYKSKKLNYSLQSFSLANNYDCFADAFVTIYKNSAWCIKFISELFLKFLWQILLFATKEKPYNQNNMNSVDVMLISNSARGNYSEKIYQQLPRRHLSMTQTNNEQNNHHRLSKNHSQHSR